MTRVSCCFRWPRRRPATTTSIEGLSRTGGGTGTKTGIGEQRFGPSISRHERRDMLAERRSRLEAVSRSPADQPDILERWVPVHEKVAVAGRLVLADPGLEQRRVPEPGKSFAQDAARPNEGLGARHAVEGRWVDLRPRAVVGDLEPATLVPWHTVDDAIAHVHPGWERAVVVLRAPRGGGEEEDLLACRDDASSDDVGKQGSHPGPAREDVVVAFDRSTVGKRHGAEPLS